VLTVVLVVATELLRRTNAPALAGRKEST
jgi:hypothetical protein